MTLRIDPEYRWLAMDKYWDWVLFCSKPILNEGGFWRISNGGHSQINIFDIPPAKDWTKSLHRHVGKTNRFERVK